MSERKTNNTKTGPNKGTSGKKLAIGLGICCIGLFIFVIVLGFIIPEDYQIEDDNIDMDDLIVNSTCVIKYGDVSKSKNYVWVSKDTGEYVEDAYSAPWTLNSTINIDLKKMYKYICNHTVEYTGTLIDTGDGYVDEVDNPVNINENDYRLLSDDFTFEYFKENLIDEIDEGRNPVNINFFELKNSANVSYTISDKLDVKYKLDNKTDTLTVYYNVDSTQLKTKSTTQDLDIIKNATSCGFMLAWSVPTNKSVSENDLSQNAQSTLKYQNLPVTVQKE